MGMQQEQQQQQAFAAAHVGYTVCLREVHRHEPTSILACQPGTSGTNMFLQYAGDVAAGMAHLHENRIVHGDLKVLIIERIWSSLGNDLCYADMRAPCWAGGHLAVINCTDVYALLMFSLDIRVTFAA
jgi:hypothetical protein